jgi:hypothetical protein
MGRKTFKGIIEKAELMNPDGIWISSVDLKIIDSGDESVQHAQYADMFDDNKNFQEGVYNHLNLMKYLGAKLSYFEEKLYFNKMNKEIGAKKKEKASLDELHNLESELKDHKSKLNKYLSYVHKSLDKKLNFEHINSELGEKLEGKIVDFEMNWPIRSSMSYDVIFPLK